MQVGSYYMHSKHKDICARVLEYYKDTGECLVEWYNLGFEGKPWPLGITDTVYINGNWLNISKLVHTPRRDWDSNG